MPKVINFTNFKTPGKKVLEITSFAGIDLSSSKADVDKRRSPNAPNMMPDSLGNPIKRNGFEAVKNYGARINGSFVLGENRLVHAGDKLFCGENLLKTGLKDEISSAQVIKDKLYIFDGKEAICYNGETAVPLSSIAYIPTVLISKNADESTRKTVLKGDGVNREFSFEHEPKEIYTVTVAGVSTAFNFAEGKLSFGTVPTLGAEITVEALYENEPGGSLKEEFNLLSNRWKESFLCDTGTETKFTLSKEGLSSGAVRAWVMDQNGLWEEKSENSDFTVNREEGKITFNSAISKTPITGEDNLVIEAEKEFLGSKDKINLCSKSITFDSKGASTRIFLCGNQSEPNKDFWCASGDPTYFPDTYYSELGGSDCKIVGYSIIEGLLATHIAPGLEGRSIVLRRDEIDESGNALFPISKYLQGEEAAAKNSFIYMEKEPLFLTKRGVYAVTAEDLSGERYTQNRSFYINKALCAEDLEKAFCAKWKQFYVISVGEKLYLLDTGQRSYEKGEPLSAFQYECYLWNGFNARVLWEEGGRLYFGDDEGNVCCFKENLYSDNGSAIEAFWTFPDFYGENFWKNKTVKTLAIEAEAFPINKLRLEYFKEGEWALLKEWTNKLSYFDWKSISWEGFTWSGNTKPRTLTLKTKIKNADKVSFRIVCGEKDRAFGLCGFAIEYSEGERFKK